MIDRHYCYNRNNLRTSDSNDWCYTQNIYTLHIWKNCLFYQCNLLIDNNDYLPTLTHHLWINEERFYEKFKRELCIFLYNARYLISTWTTPKKAFQFFQNNCNSTILYYICIFYQEKYYHQAHFNILNHNYEYLNLQIQSVSSTWTSIQSE